jgi:hypothetical protein
VKHVSKNTNGNPAAFGVRVSTMVGLYWTSGESVWN